MNYDKPNILISAYCVDKNDVGEAKMAYEWITRLAQKVNLTLITAGSRIHDTTGFENDPRISMIILKPKISFKFFDTFDRAVHPGYVEFFFRAKKQIRKITQENNIHLCHHLAPRSLRYPCPFINASKPYIVGPFHGGLKPPAVMKQLGAKESPLFLMRKLDTFRINHCPHLKKHYANAARIVVSAPYVKENLPQKYHSKTTVIYGVGIEPEKITQPQTKHDQTINLIFVGRLVPSKGLELLLHAIAKVNNPNIKLSVFGKGPCLQKYKDIASSLGIENNIQWLGFQPNENVTKTYPQMDIFTLPSLKEPAGIAVIEAMAAGLPVICVDAGGPAYSVTKQTGIKVPLDSKQQMIANLAQAIDTLSLDTTLRHQMAQNAQHRVKTQFTWNVLIEKMTDLYQQVINEHNTR